MFSGIFKIPSVPHSKLAVSDFVKIKVKIAEVAH